LRLQLFQLEYDSKVSGPFQDSINRISTMALIHEKMYKGDKINNLSVKDYVTDLASDLVRTYATSTKVAVSVESDIEQLKMDDLVPFSLILNELITNSIKHGFRDNKTGQISINLKSTTIGFDLTYNDSGVWKENAIKTSFGLELIETLNGHFDGIYNRKLSDSGTEYLFNLKLY
jgi:two-component sensor histidine kinase